MKKRKRRRKGSCSNYSRLDLIQLKKKVIAMIKANKDEVVIKNEDEVMDMDMDEVRGPTTKTTTSKEEKAQQEVEGEAIQNRGMTRCILSATIVKSLVIMLSNVELLAIIELNRRQTTLKKEVKKMVPYYWLIRIMKEVKIIDGT